MKVPYLLENMLQVRLLWVQLAFFTMCIALISNDCLAYDCINLTHSPCGIWTMVENWHTTVMVTIQIL